MIVNKVAQWNKNWLASIHFINEKLGATTAIDFSGWAILMNGFYLNQSRNILWGWPLIYSPVHHIQTGFGAREADGACLVGSVCALVDCFPGCSSFICREGSHSNGQK
jgi:hypothetical protein